MDDEAARSAARGHPAERAVVGTARPNPARRRATTTTKPAWPWAAAAAALLIVTLLLQTAAAGLRHGVRDAKAAFARDMEDIEDELTVAWRDAGGLSEEEARLVARVHGIQMRISIPEQAGG